MAQMLAEREVRPSLLPGAAVVRGIRRLAVLALFMSIIYSLLATASWASCPGGFDSTGGFIDANGDPTSIAPSCVSLAMSSNPLVFVIFVLIGIGALSSALKKSRTEADALRYLNSAAVVIAGITVVTLVVSHVWFWNLSVDEWDGIGDLVLHGPFPFAVITTDISPMVR